MKNKTFIFFLSLLLIIGLFPISALSKSDYIKLEAPTNLKVDLMEDSEGVPYFRLTLDVPKSVKDLNQKILEDSHELEGINIAEVEVHFEYKYADYDWNQGPSSYWNTSAYLEEFLEKGCYEYYPFDSSTKIEEIDIKSETYYFRARFNTLWGHEGGWMNNNVYSDYSNIVEIGNPSYWSTASDWATPELKKAADEGLIPEILKGADMTKPITREEFAEVALLMYQKASGNTGTPATPNPFTDTQNSKILIAYQLGIVKGTSPTTFESKTLINREQVAAMLARTIKLIAPNADYSTEGAPIFDDQADISAWALNDCLYMAKLGIIKGSDGKFMPRAVTEAQAAMGYANTSREQALAMSVRTVDKIKEIKGTIISYGR